MPNYQSIWNELNERQRHYLKAIFTIDQEVESDHKYDYFHGRWGNASDWRWMNYDPINNERWSWLQEKIGDAMIDPGTGSTLEALQVRGLIEKRGHPENSAILQLQLTRLGRAVARAGLGVKRVTPPKKPKQVIEPPPETDATRWAKALRTWRGERGLRQIHSEGLIGELSIATFSRLENGRPPTLAEFEFLCGVCGLNAGDYSELMSQLKGSE